MSIFSKLKKAANPGGAIVSAFAGNGKNYIGPLDYLMDKDKAPKAPPQTPFDPGQRVGASINGQSGVAQPAMRLGWTNGGYTYHNSPFNGAQGQYFQQPQSPMSFGGNSLPAQPSGGSMPSAGAPAQPSAPTAPNPEMLRAIMVRNRGMMM